jgi:ABC-2 type transport system permease protein
MPESIERDQRRSPLLLLVRVHLIQNWRRLKSVREQSRLLTSVIVAFIVGYLGLSYWLFFAGLRFASRFLGFGTVLVERLLYLMFAFLFALLLLSNLVIAYTNFFRNRETAFLLTAPVSRQTVFRWKFIESTVLASWAFVFLIAPLVAAFGRTQHVPWHFYFATVLLVALFIVLPGVIGAWLAIHLARRLDRRSFQRAIVSVSLLLVVAAALWWKTPPPTEDMIESRTLDMLDQLLIKTRFAQFPFLPSYWLSASVLYWAEGALSSAAFFALVLLSNVAFFGLAAFTRLGEIFYDTASAVQSRGSADANAAIANPSRALGAAPAGTVEKLWQRFPGLSSDVRALLVKDTRMFWRDTAQWGQCAMLFGLLGVYIINLRHFTHQLYNPFWINLVAYLNLSACALNLATLTTRFVYPQFSLEGQRLWIIGLAPLGLERIVKIKYTLATGASLVVTLSLITLSCYLLRMSVDQILFFCAVVTIMTFALNGLAVGLGVLYPNFKEPNPSKIVSGFGGTLCLVLSFLYILASVLVLALGTSGFRARKEMVFGSIALFTLLSLFVGGLPLRWGFRYLKKLEF